MKISNKAIVASIGCVTVGVVSFLLHSGECLWALALVYFLVDITEN